MSESTPKPTPGAPLVLHRYWQPPPAWKSRGKRTLSVPMTDAEAAARGLTDLDPSTREERHLDGGTDAGMANVGTAPKHGHRMD